MHRSCDVLVHHSPVLLTAVVRQQLLSVCLMDFIHQDDRNVSAKLLAHYLAILSLSPAACSSLRTKWIGKKGLILGRKQEV